MISFEESVEISCGVSRVWRALTIPSEVVQWDTGVSCPIDAPADYPKPGQHVRWKYRLGPIPMTLHDRPTEVVPDACLRSSIQLGPFQIDEIYRLESAGERRTRLSAALRLWSEVPFVGGLLERTLGRPLARTTVRSSLAAIRRHCEFQATGGDQGKGNEAGSAACLGMLALFAGCASSRFYPGEPRMPTELASTQPHR